MEKEIKEQILEWNSYLPEVKRQSIDVLVENIINLAVAKRDKEIVEKIEAYKKEISIKEGDEVNLWSKTGKVIYYYLQTIINLITNK